MAQKETKWYRYNVVANFPNFKKEFFFSGIDRTATFYLAVNFAGGLISGYLVNNHDLPISTNAAQEADGYIWWNTKTGENVLYITGEDGEIVKLVK